MGLNVDIDWEVEYQDDIKALKAAVENGIDDAGTDIVEKGEDKMVEYITTRERVFSSQLIESIGTITDPKGAAVAQARMGYWRGVIKADAEHAKLVDDGLKPGMYGEEGPQVQDIINWVVAKLPISGNRAFNVSEWHPDLQALAASHSPQAVQHAFAVKKGLERYGYPGINYTGVTESYMKKIGAVTVKTKVEAKMKQYLKTVNAGGSPPNIRT